MPEALRLLMAEDSGHDAALLEAELRAGGFAPEIQRVVTEEQFRAALDGQDWDLVLLDFSLPRFSALRALEILRERARGLPAVVVSLPCARPRSRIPRMDRARSRDRRRNCAHQLRSLGRDSERLRSFHTAAAAGGMAPSFRRHSRRLALPRVGLWSRPRSAVT